ncbi:hypothetical protein PoB_005931600 [Plakobranchus ocellatus]|uniref:Uncharacterized protein n=1 Tax=Plakobranchus ocellatus TaxID=259542 RepID=A0AAV4CIV5_9GAST|nr:hypothetical protein PoB_005931600 [Plakobranchus ocellatus]
MASSLTFSWRPLNALDYEGLERGAELKYLGLILQNCGIAAVLLTSTALVTLIKTMVLSMLMLMFLMIVVVLDYWVADNFLI